MTHKAVFPDVDVWRLCRRCADAAINSGREISERFGDISDEEKVFLVECFAVGIFERRRAALSWRPSLQDTINWCRSGFDIAEEALITAPAAAPSSGATKRKR